MARCRFPAQLKGPRRLNPAFDVVDYFSWPFRNCGQSKVSSAWFGEPVPSADLRTLPSAHLQRPTNSKYKATGPFLESGRSSRAANGYFLDFVFFGRAVDPYRLAKHFLHRRSRRLMKLGAKSSLPQ